MRVVTSPPQETTFHFHPRASNPELWRPSLPLIVKLRTDYHKGLIATWQAIHWLIVLYASSGRTSFGMRDIANEANVGRNELAGKHGYIQRLVDLKLIQIVGYEKVPGLREQRPIYHIDLAELERLSIESVPDVLRRHNLPPPPRPTPDPRQLGLFDADPTPQPDAGLINGPDRIAPSAMLLLNGTGRIAPHTPTHPNGPATHANGPVTVVPSFPERDGEPSCYPVSGTDPRTQLIPTPANGPAMHENGTDQPLNLPPMPANGPAMHENGTVLSRNQDMEGGKEGKKEGEREQTRPLAPDLQSFAATITQTVIETLRREGFVAPQVVGATESPHLPPAGQPPLPASYCDLWQGDQPTMSIRDRHQLMNLAATYDAKTAGYGPYWVGRAILEADSCLRDKGRSLSLNYVRGILRRWDEQDSWGSDVISEEPHARSTKAERKADRAMPVADASEPASTADVSQAPPPDPEPLHPALAAYTTAFGRTPNSVQAAQIRATVTDEVLWQQVLTEWQANGWKEAAVAKMLDRYRKEAGLMAPAEPERPPSVRVIHEYPGLTMDEREIWIMRFHRAEKPAEKRAVLARLAQEHPL